MKQNLKIDYKKEATVLAAIVQNGERTRQELLDILKTNFNLVLTESELMRYLGIWKSKKIVTVRTRSGDEVWAIKDIPPWYCSGVMTLVQSASGDLKMEIDALDERLKNEGGRIKEPKSIYTDFVSYNMVFQNIDPILGGHSTDEDRKLMFPRNHGKLCIPPNWMKGFIRDNEILMNVAALQYHVAIGVGIYRNTPKTFRKILKGKIGMTDFEAVDEDEIFDVVMRFPSKGTKLKNDEDIKKFFALCAEAPIRGIGAYPHALGGRIKLLEMQKLSA